MTRRDCGTDPPADVSQTPCKNEGQDYAARFGVSSEGFRNNFLKLHFRG
jgi:hypothetical protein